MIRLEAATRTDPGREREMNEDSVWAQVIESSEGSPMGAFIVCDGLGGHMGGEVASHWAVETLKVELAELFNLRDPRATIRLSEEEINSAIEGKDMTRLSVGTKFENQIRFAIQKANRVVHEYTQKRPEKAAEAGTTVTLAVIFGRRLIVANVGDSRAYLLRDHKLRQITTDHSLVASLVSSGQLKPEEVYSHPQRNVIYRSLGQKRQVQIDTFWEVLQPDDYLLLCSDGLWEMVQEESLIVRLIEGAKSLDHACEKLVEAANAAGGEDNISVVLVQTA